MTPNELHLKLSWISETVLYYQPRREYASKQVRDWLEWAEERLTELRRVVV